MTTPAEQYRALVNRLEAIQEDGIFKGKGNGLLGQQNIPTQHDASTPGTSEYRGRVGAFGSVTQNPQHKKP